MQTATRRPAEAAAVQTDPPVARSGRGTSSPIETRPATVVEPLPLDQVAPAQDAPSPDSPAPHPLDASMPAKTPAASMIGGVRSVEVSGRAAELVRRMAPGGGRARKSVAATESGVRNGRVRIVAPVGLGRTVRIVGDLNHWQPEGMPLSPLPGLARDLIGIDLPTAGPLRYRLVVDGRPMLDPKNSHVVEGPDGRPANVLTPAVPDGTDVRPVAGTPSRS